MWKPLPSGCVLETLKGNSKESSKRTISASSELGSLHKVAYQPYFFEFMVITKNLSIPKLVNMEKSGLVAISQER